MAGIKLKPCPFCGGEATIEKVDDDYCGTAYAAKCNECGCQTVAWYTPEMAAEYWNRRKEFKEERYGTERICKEA